MGFTISLAIEVTSDERPMTASQSRTLLRYEGELAETFHDPDLFEALKESLGENVINQARNCARVIRKTTSTLEVRVKKREASQKAKDRLKYLPISEFRRR